MNIPSVKRLPAIRKQEVPQTLRQHFTENAFLYQIIIGVIIILFINRIGYSYFDDKNDYLANLLIEGSSVLLTILVLDRLAQRRESQHEDERLKATLITRMGNTIKNVAIPAAEELRRRGWLVDGSLQGAPLWGAKLQRTDLWRANLQRAVLVEANLQGAVLVEANLQGAVLGRANLQGAPLWGAKLQGAHLWKAKLQGVDLTRANLQGAVLENANLQRASLWSTNLQGAILGGANLQGASLWKAKFDEDTVLPDAEWDKATGDYTSTWTPDTDMGRFTDPEHPEFWSTPRVRRERAE